MSQLLTKQDIKKIAERYPEGISSQEIVHIFQSRGMKFSEATFRKYVQMGLVERCKRVGEKGKHRGSHGLYPVSTVERINDIKRLISGDMTLEQLKGSYFSMKHKMEEAVRIVNDVRTELAAYVQGKGERERHDAQIERELDLLLHNASQVISTLDQSADIMAGRFS